MSNSLASQQVSWLPVYEYASVEAARFGVDLAAEILPVPGTPDWCAMPDDGRKLAAVLLLGAQYALELDGRQEAAAEASRAVSEAAAWRQVAQEMQQRTAFRQAHPWAKRVAR